MYESLKSEVNTFVILKVKESTFIVSKVGNARLLTEGYHRGKCS